MRGTKSSGVSRSRRGGRPRPAAGEAAAAPCASPSPGGRGEPLSGSRGRPGEPPGRLGPSLRPPAWRRCTCARLGLRWVLRVTAGAAPAPGLGLALRGAGRGGSGAFALAFGNRRSSSVSDVVPILAMHQNLLTQCVSHYLRTLEQLSVRSPGMHLPDSGRQAEMP